MTTNRKKSGSRGCRLIVFICAVTVTVLIAIQASASAAPSRNTPASHNTMFSPASAAYGQMVGSTVFDDEFNGTRVDAGKWWVYNGPGNEGNGVRRPSQVTQKGGALTITCTTKGVCGGMMARRAQTYGTWAARVKMSTASANVHPVLLLWPTDDVWPSHGEIDYMEVSNPTRKTAEGFLHFGANNVQTQASVNVDLTQWHVFSVTWTPQAITYYVDGRQWFQDANPSHQPPVAVNPTIQLDDAGGPIGHGGTMTVDWVRIYGR